MVDAPVAMFAEMDGLTERDAMFLARRAAVIAAKNAPKLSGKSAKRIYPYWGQGFFGVKWADNYVWFQDQGINAFTMKSLEGKTIPMWVDDDGSDPKAEKRTTESGKNQMLIFRRVGKKGETKQVKQNGHWSTKRNTNYPGGAGRISLREAARPFTTAGRVGGRVARGNVGVSWRHPGLQPRHFLLNGIQQVAQENGVFLGDLFSETINGEREQLPSG